MSVSKRIKSRRCDEPMRRSKEECWTPWHTKWKCTEDCRNCICCIEKDRYGGESHFNPRYKGETEDEQ